MRPGGGGQPAVDAQRAAARADPLGVGAGHDVQLRPAFRAAGGAGRCGLAGAGRDGGSGVGTMGTIGIGSVGTGSSGNERSAVSGGGGFALREEHGPADQQSADDEPAHQSCATTPKGDHGALP